MAVHRLRLCKVLSLIPIVILGLCFILASASADSASGEPHDDPGTVWCDERIRELETAFDTRLTNEVQSTQSRADESCKIRLVTEINGQKESANALQARLTEMQTLLDTTQDHTSALEGTIQELQTQIATKADQSNSCAVQLQKTMTTLQTQTARVDELESALQKHRDSCMNDSATTLQQQVHAMQEAHVQEMDARVVAAVQEAHEEHARKLKMVQHRRDALVAENDEIKALLASSKSQLQATKNELFEMRQELFHTNEKLREASRRWYQILLPAPFLAWLEQLWTSIAHTVQDTWKSTLASPRLLQVKEKYVVPYLEKAGIPDLWRKIQVHARPLAGMAWSITTTIYRELLALLQTARQELPVYGRACMKQIRFYWNEFVTVAGPKVNAAWDFTKDTSHRMWQQVRVAAQPLVDQIPWEKLEPHLQLVQRLWQDLMRDTEWIRVEFAIYCSQIMIVLQQAAETMHRYAIHAFHYVVRTSHLLLKMYEAPAHVVEWTEGLHAESETVIWYIEAALGTFLAMYIASKVLGVGRGTGAAKRTFKADPAYSNGGGSTNGSSTKKLERIAKREAEKVAKKKQVQFAGR
jgi:hypothetical protein